MVENYKVKVHVTLKETVNDPEGITIHRALNRLGFEEIESVRSGKYFEIIVDSLDEQLIDRKVNEMCSNLLANPVIEQYHYSFEKNITN